MSIKNLDERVLELLRVRAARHGRSMEAEVRAILTDAVREQGDGPNLAAGELDLALVGTVIRPAGVRLHQLGSVRYSLVCGRRHRLADASSVRLEDLAGETFIDFPLGWGNRTMADRAFANAGIVRSIPFEAADQDTALGLVRNGLGVALLPRAGSEEEGVAVIEVDDADLDLPVAVATSSEREPSAATAALLASILRAASRRAGSQPVTRGGVAVP